MDEYQTDEEMYQECKRCLFDNNYEKMLILCGIGLQRKNWDIVNILGIYYQRKGDYDNMMKYYLMAIENGVSKAMMNIGHFYKEQGDIHNMMRYYQMAIENGYHGGMFNLGCYYKEVGDDVNMVKYYKLASENGSVEAMNNLGMYYKKEKDYDNMIKYYLQAIENGESKTMYNLGIYYRDEENYEKMVKYFLMSIENNKNQNIIRRIIHNLIDCAPNKIYLLMEHFKYFDKSNMKLLNRYLSQNKYLTYNRHYKKEDCCICYDKKHQLRLHCGHYVCVDCYNFIDKCPICRDEF